jgi:predicted nucleic acid-binding protein
MNRAVRDALITDYEEIIETLHLPDPDDRHVLAAAIHGNAQAIVTSNARHFPTRGLSQYDIEASRPDAFVAGLLNQHPLEVITALRMQRLRLANPPLSVEEFLDNLARQGLRQTVTLLKSRAEEL